MLFIAKLTHRRPRCAALERRFCFIDKLNKRVTIKDIAAQAGVSSATVSYVLNDAPSKSISDKTRQRILKLAQEMQYVPNVAARQLKTNRTNCVAVRLNSSLMMRRQYALLQGIRAYLTPRSYSLLLCNDNHEHGPSSWLTACQSGQADGLIYISATGKGLSDEEMAFIQKSNVPLSTVECRSIDPAVNSVDYDYYASSRMRMDYLLQHGYRKFIYVRPSYENYKETAREHGVRSVLTERSDVSVEVYRCPFWDQTWFDKLFFSLRSQQTQDFDADVVSYVKKAMSTVGPDTAVLCYSNEAQDLVAHLLYADHIGHNTPETARWYERSISYRFPHYECGVEAARSLLSAIDGSSEVRKLSLLPTLLPTDPALF